MKIRAAVALSAAAMLSLAACSSGGSSSDGIEAPAADASGSLKIWLMDGSSPDSVTESVSAQFNEAYPDVEVEVELQQWAGIQDKLSTSLNTDATPCVVEIGNSLVSKYADAGLLTDISDEADGLGSSAWLPGLAEAGEYDGSRFSAPMYGGDRIVVYSKSDFAAAGIDEIPTTLEEFEAAAGKLAAEFGDPSTGYSAFYFPGKYWYGALPFVWTYGGDIAEQNGSEWTGTIDSAEAQEALTFLDGMVQDYSAAPKDGDETKNFNAFLEGDIGMMIDSWWSPGAIVSAAEEAGDTEMAQDVGAFVMPGVSADETAPVFLGGSDLAISQRCAADQKGLALEWMKIYTGVENQTMLAKEGGNIPIMEEAFAGHEGNEFLEVADAAAEVSKFTPVTPLWANVEAESVLPDMLVKIFTGQASVEDATADANAQITSILNP